MERIKRILKKVFCLPPLPTVLIALPSLTFVFILLALGIQGIPAYIAYLLSAYGLVILVTGFPWIIRSVQERIENSRLVQKMQSHPLGNRLLNDVFFRAEVSLYPGLLINLLYVGIKLYSGIYYHSLWFGALSVYYLLLALMRSMLLRSARMHPMGQDIAYELRWYRFCGFFLLVMNQALTAIVIFVVYQDRGFDYPGVLIYAMALYAFYAVISAVVSLVKQRKHGSPVMSATRVVKLTAALVSMLSLETAMLARFGGEGASGFRRRMTGVSGGMVCVFVLGMAVFMIVKSTRQMKQIKINGQKQGKEHLDDGQKE